MRPMTAADDRLFSRHFCRRTADEMVDVELQFMEADIVDDVRHGRTHRRLRHGEVRTNSPS
jgi:hypothetical protein